MTEQTSLPKQPVLNYPQGIPSAPTQALTVVPNNNLYSYNPVANMDAPATVVPVAVAGLYGLYLSVRQLRRLRSKDVVEYVKDRAETDIVKILQDEIGKLRTENDRLKQRLDEVSEERNNAVQQLGKLASISEANKEKVTELQAAVAKMTEKIDEQTNLLQEVLEENAFLKADLRNVTLVNQRLERELSDIRASIDKLKG